MGYVFALVKGLSYVSSCGFYALKEKDADAVTSAKCAGGCTFRVTVMHYIQATDDRVLHSGQCHRQLYVTRRQRHQIGSCSGQGSRRFAAACAAAATTAGGRGDLCYRCDDNRVEPTHKTLLQVHAVSLSLIFSHPADVF